jgi:hypothetical protein
LSDKHPPFPGSPFIQVAKKVSDLKSQGNKMFAQKDWAKAIEQYESAMKMLPAGHAERGDLLCNKAACLMGLNRYCVFLGWVGVGAGVLVVSTGTAGAVHLAAAKHAVWWWTSSLCVFLGGNESAMKMLPT